MASPLWLFTWWGVFGDKRRLRVWTFWRGDELVGVAPLCLRRHWYPPAIPFRRLELLGSGEDEADEICSDYLGVVAAPGEEEAVARAFLDALDEGGWDELLLPAMRADAAMTTAISGELGARGWSLAVDRSRACPYIPLPATWEAYLGQLSSSHRYLVNRSLRDFDAWAKTVGPVRLEAARDAASLAAGREILAGLHGERWRADGSDGVFASPRFRAFHDAVMPSLLARDQLELLWLTVGDMPIAAVYSLVWRGRTLFYQSGRRVDLPAKLRPGIVLHAHAIRRAIGLGRREYDFLAGESRYKAQLALATRPLASLRATRSLVREAALGLVESAKVVIRSKRGAVSSGGDAP